MGLFTSGTVDTVASAALNWASILIATVLIGVFVAIMIFVVLNKKKYGEFSCLILKKHDNGNITYSTDKGGIFVDNVTNNKRFFLRRSNVGLETDKIPFILSEGGILGSKKIVFLLQTGLKNFRFIDIHIDNPEVGVMVGEEDVNWALNSYEKSKKVLSNNFIKEYAPMIGVTIIGAIMLIMFIYMFKNIPQITALVQEIRDLAVAVASAKSGTVVLT